MKKQDINNFEIKPFYELNKSVTKFVNSFSKQPTGNYYLIFMMM